MTAQTKRVINEEINILLLGKGSNTRIATREVKELCALKLGGQKDEKRSDDCVPFNVCVPA